MPLPQRDYTGRTITPRAKGQGPVDPYARTAAVVQITLRRAARARFRGDTAHADRALGTALRLAETAAHRGY